MENEAKKKSKVALYVTIAIVVIVALVVGGFFLLKGQSDKIRQETLTAENMEQVITKLENSMQNEDELYYFTYAVTYYMMRDAMAAATSGNTDESAIYANVYGKTVQQLMDEGKQIAKDNNLTIEQVKARVDELSKGAQ